MKRAMVTGRRREGDMLGFGAAQAAFQRARAGVGAREVIR